MSHLLRVALAAGLLGIFAQAAFADDEPEASPSDTSSKCACSSPACDYASCDSCDWGCDCDPGWAVSVGAVFLNRSRPDPKVIVQQIGSSAQISGGQDFSFNWATGPDISIARRFASGNSLEVRYSGALDWHSDVQYGAPGNFQLGSFFNFLPTDLSANYQSTLNSTEINALHPVSDRVTLLAGFRWIELHDELHYNVSFIPFSAVYNWNTDNHLYGAQVGGNFDLWELDSPLSIKCAMKAGVYGNPANNDFSLAPSTGGLFTGGASSAPVSFVSEINVTAAYHVNDHVALRGGYQLLWIDRVALASDQAAQATAQLSQNNIDTSSNVFYHGAMAGVDFTW